MIKFVLKAEYYFKAEDIDDAFHRLEDHFYNLRTDKSDDSLLDKTTYGGEMSIEPIDEQ